MSFKNPKDKAEYHKLYQRKRYRAANKEALSKARMDYYRAHKEQEQQRAREYYHVNRDKMRELAREKTRSLRAAAIAKLGGKCADKDCRHLNIDGTLGCTDILVLQIDHVFNDGAKERKERSSLIAFYKAVIDDETGRFQLLCPTCNARKQLRIQIKKV